MNPGDVFEDVTNVFRQQAVKLSPEVADIKESHP